MPSLVRHPDAPPGAIRAIEAELERVDGGAIATFRAIGDIERLVLPPAAPEARTDGLWRTSCFELFVSGDGEQYHEYNFSPSGAWAAYAFDRYREGMRDAHAELAITTRTELGAFTLVARLAAELPLPAKVGLTAVIEERDGLCRYWSTGFAPGKADFHAAAVRSLILDGVSAE